MKNQIEIRQLALISAAAVLRKQKRLRELIQSAAGSKIKPVKIYEALLQTYLFAGFPSALISLKILSEVYPVEGTQKYEHDEYKLKITGEKNCRKIYGDKFEKLIYNVNSFSPELSEWLVIEGYGKVFSRKNLTLAERELLIIVVLASLKYESQLYSHLNGAYRLHLNPQLIELTLNDLKLISPTGSRFGLKVWSIFKIKKGLTAP
jgi:4-carboxymuconolactone decarboxylase